MFRRLLIANRGEIACRIARTAKALGLTTIAVYSEADAAAWHVAVADEAYPIGPAPARDSYLDIAAVLAAARKGRAEAVHPGYGFLAENADFAEACTAAGLLFVGPPAAAMRLMGSKDAARAAMQAAGVPVVPGYHGRALSLARLTKAAGEIGYPVMIKPAAGGGGKGMRRVAGPGALAAALAAARREALAAFGDARLILERCLERPRHVEVQVFADGQGNAVHLFERDCSLQRRHQKVIEEAPAPDLAAGLRRGLAKAALDAVRAIGYEGAGTVEFLVKGKEFYFMEMNTRLQVEHPVTEMIAGVDLVAWQLRVAAGEPLPCRQRDLAAEGHAIEARLYAEDPARDFLPVAGRLARLRLPAEDERLRIDSGVREGDEVPVHYDPLLAKIIAQGADRSAALARLAAALEEVEAGGLATNRAFLAALARDPEVAAGRVDTEFIARNMKRLVPPVDDRVLALASLAELSRRRAETAARARGSADPFSPWRETGGWRLNMEDMSLLSFEVEGATVSVTVRGGPAGYHLGLGAREVLARGALDEGRLSAEIDGETFSARVAFEGAEIRLGLAAAEHSLQLYDPLIATRRQQAGSGRITAPIPGKLVEVRAAAGAEVKRGEVLLRLEAMKMEHGLAAPMDARVAAVHYEAGDLVEEGVVLLDLEPLE